MTSEIGNSNVLSFVFEACRPYNHNEYYPMDNITRQLKSHTPEPTNMQQEPNYEIVNLIQELKNNTNQYSNAENISQGKDIHNLNATVPPIDELSFYLLRSEILTNVDDFILNHTPPVNQLEQIIEFQVPCVFVEQPQSTFKFVFKSEIKKSQSYLKGENYTKNNQTFPRVELKTPTNLEGIKLFLHVDLYQNPSNLSGHIICSFKSSTEEACAQLILEADKIESGPTGSTVTFDLKNLYILQTQPKDFAIAIARKAIEFIKWKGKKPVPDMKTMTRRIHWPQNDENIFLGCAVFLEGENGLFQITERIFSNPMRKCEKKYKAEKI